MEREGRKGYGIKLNVKLRSDIEQSNASYVMHELPLLQFNKLGWMAMIRLEYNLDDE